jgi:sarcosine oxidase
MRAGGNRDQARRTEVVVAGAGLLGLSTAFELGRRGHDVVCLEAATVGHERSGSKGESRLFRLSHDDPLYVRLALRSLAGWERLQAQAGEQLLEPATLLMFGDRMSRFVEAMAAAGAHGRLVTRAELRERFDGFAFDGPGGFQGEALCDDSAAIMRADAILRALTRLARAEVRQREPVTKVTEYEDHVLVETFAGRYRCDCVVLCAGAWSGELARGAGLPRAGHLEPSIGPVGYLRRWSGELGAAPAFMELARASAGGLPSYAWGVPTPASGTYKIGLHRPRERIDPSSVPLDPDDAELAELSDRAASLLPGFDPRPVATERCLFDSSPDEELVIDRVGRVVIGAGTSGRGFKFGPVIGELLADLAEGRAPELWDRRFAWSRLGTG